MSYLAHPVRAAQAGLVLWCLGNAALLVFGDTPWALDAAETGWKADTVRGLYWGAAANAVLALGLAATAGWWARYLPRPEAAIASRFAAAPPRWFGPALGAAVALAGVLHFPLAEKSLWWDELWQVKQASHGFSKAVDGGGEPEFRGTSWGRCAWYYQKPTNHVPAALGAKVSVGLWQRLTGAGEEAFSDLAVRAPAVLASLVAVMVVGLVGRRWGGPAAGVAAAFVLALHPWHLRYGTDARAYAFLVLWITLGCFFLSRVVAGGKARDWVGLGLVQFLLVWSLPNAFWYAGGFFGAGVVLLARAWRRGDARRTALARLVATNVFAAMLLFQVFGPNIVQAWRWMGTIYEPHYLNPRLLLDTVAFLGTGTPRALPDVVEAAGLATLDGWPVGWAALALGLLGAAAGAFLLTRRDRSARTVVVAMVGAAVLYLAFTVWNEDHYYPRYLIYLLPVFALLFGVFLGRLYWWAALAVFGIWAAGVAPQVRVLMTRPYAPLRDVASFLENAEGTRPETALWGIGLGSRVLETYLPTIRYVLEPDEIAELDEAVGDADAGRARLLVFYGYPSFNRATLPGAFEVLDDPSRFREIAAFPAIEPEFYYRVLEYLPGGPAAETRAAPDPKR